MQVGPNPSIQPAPAIPDELRELRRRSRENAPVVELETDPLALCLARAEESAAAAVVEADARVARLTGADRALALHCRGVAQAEMLQWSQAADSFVQARDDTPTDEYAYRARLGAMAGAAHLADNDPADALTVLDIARRDARQADFAALQGEIELDRARALVALDQWGDKQAGTQAGEQAGAGEALAQARRLIPRSSQAWLLSATLARRTQALETARQFIAQAKLLAPDNAQILVEAGVIAVLSGDEDSARRDWNAAIASSASSETDAERAAAQTYLQQLDPA